MDISEGSDQPDTPGIDRFAFKKPASTSRIKSVGFLKKHSDHLKNNGKTDKNAKNLNKSTRSTRKKKLFEQADQLHSSGMDTLIFTFTENIKGKNVVDCKVKGDYAQKMFCSSVGQSFSNLWKGKEAVGAQESIEEVEATVPNVADTDQRSAGSASLLATGKEVEATVPNVADTDQSSAGSASLLATGKEVEATVPNVADTDQRSASSASLLATGKRLRESFTTHEENMDADSSPVARKIRINTARAASAMPKKGISTTESEETQISTDVSPVPSVTHLIQENQGKMRYKFLIHLSDVKSEAIIVYIPHSRTKCSEEELCNKVKKMWEEKNKVEAQRATIVKQPALLQQSNV